MQTNCHLAYFMMTHPLPIAGKLPIKTLVARQLPTNVVVVLCACACARSRADSAIRLDRQNQFYHYDWWLILGLLRHWEMPYWSIGEWRARIGSSWCALGRPFKMRSPFRGKTTQRALTLNQGVATLFLLIMSIGVNLGLRTLVARGHHLPLLSEWYVWST